MMRFGSLGPASAVPAPFAVRAAAGDDASFGADAVDTTFGAGCGDGDAGLRAAISAAVRTRGAVGGGTTLAAFTVAVAGGPAAALDDGAAAAGIAGLAAAPDGEAGVAAAGLAVAGAGGAAAAGADGFAGFGTARGGSGRKGIAPRSPPFGGFDTVTADNPLLPNA